MYVVVIGLGQVGKHIVRTLEWERHDVVAIDAAKEAVAAIEEHHDVMSLRGYGASERTLKRARVEQADLVVAVTDHDEVNLIAALASKQLGAKKAIARVQGDEWSGIEEHVPKGVHHQMLGVDVVFNPRVLLAQEIAKIALSHGALEVIDLANDRIEVAQVELPEHGRLLHKPLAKLQLPDAVRVGAVVRDDELFVPGGTDVLLPKDRIYLIGRREQMADAEDLFTHRSEAASVCIVGGGVVGHALARMLGTSRTEVLLIEADVDRAQTLAEALPNATIVAGDGTDMALLTEERVGRFDFFAAVTNDDEVNLMAGLLAQRVGVSRTVALVHRHDYSDIYRQLGIDIVLSPRTVASEHVLRHCRDHNLHSLSILEDGKAEILEVTARSNTQAVGRPLRDLHWPRGSLLAAILRQNTVLLPAGDDTIHPGDSVVILTTPEARKQVTRLFRIGGS